MVFLLRLANNPLKRDALLKILVEKCPRLPSGDLGVCPLISDGNEIPLTAPLLKATGGGVAPRRKIPQLIRLRILPAAATLKNNKRKLIVDAIV